MLARTRDALREASPAAYVLAQAHRGEYFAGGVAPDALRLFGGADKFSTHFYDDERPETWEQVVETIRRLHPPVARPGELPAASRAWMLGYLSHVLTDIAYWRHVLAHLPRFPEQPELHHGAWILADQVARPPADERAVDAEAVSFAAAPPWVREAPVRQMLARLTGRILLPDDTWPAEVAYYRSRPDAAGRTDEELLATYRPQWEAALEAARAAIPPGAWAAFQQEAVDGAVRAVLAYLDGA
jgi:hypothetical protein